ncbi:MAG: hypothetical protein ACYCTW_02100 [Sulfuricella sp.]
MEPFITHPLLIWIAQHPYWVGIAISLVSLSESRETAQPVLLAREPEMP